MYLHNDNHESCACIAYVSMFSRLSITYRYKCRVLTELACLVELVQPNISANALSMVLDWVP